MLFRYTDSEFVDEIQKAYPEKRISQSTISRMKREIRKDYLNHYRNIRKNKELFAYLVMEKYNTVDSIIKEYRKMYLNEHASSTLRFKILEKLIVLDHYQLSLLQDLPYLGIYHNDARGQLRNLRNELKDLKQEVTVHSSLDNNTNLDNIPEKDKELPDNITDITKINPGIQAILKKRADSGLAPYFKKQIL